MSKIFEFNGNRQGTFIDSVSKTSMTPTNVTFKRTEKGQSSFFLKSASIEQINTNRTLIPETGDFSIEAYINLSNVIQTGDPNFDSYPIISQGGDSFTLYAATWYGSSNGNLRLYVASQILVGTNVRGKGWKHIILTRNGDNWDLFLDNKLNASNTSSASIHSADTLIGFTTLGTKRFKGFINKVAIYNHALSEKERELRFREFLQSQITEKPIRGFELVKPTDLSYLKDRGLVAAYNFKRNGNTLVDISGNGLNGTILSGNSTKDGMSHNVGAGIAIRDGALITTLDYTICGRVKINNLMATDGVLFSNDNDSSNTIIDSLGFKSGKLAWNYDSVGTFKNETTNPFVLGVWSDFVFISNGGRTGTIKVYIDGIEQTITTTGFYRSGDDVRIFNRSNSDRPFIGECSDLRIYTRAFTEAEVKAYHNSWVNPVILEDWSGSAVGDTI